jgi:hypothetical protein
MDPSNSGRPRIVANIWEPIKDLILLIFPAVLCPLNSCNSCLLPPVSPLLEWREVACCVSCLDAQCSAELDCQCE